MLLPSSNDSYDAVAEMLAGHSTFRSNTATEQVQLISRVIFGQPIDPLLPLLLKKNAIDAQRLVDLARLTDDGNTSKLLHEPCHRERPHAQLHIQRGKFFTQFATHPPATGLPSPQNRGPVPNASRFTELEARRGFKHQNGAAAGLLIGTWRYPAIRSPKTMDGAGTHAATQALLPLAIFMLGPMRSTETFSHVSAEQVGDVYLFSSGEPEVWNPTGYKRCLGPISESRTPEYLGTVNNTALYQLRMLYKFKSSRDFPLAKLDILYHLPDHLDEVILVDGDARIMPWYDSVFRANLQLSRPDQWLLASRSGVRSPTGSLLHSYDGPQPGGALLRLNVLREFQRDCSHGNSPQFPNVNSRHSRGLLVDLDRWSWWRCLYVEAMFTSMNSVRTLFDKPNNDLGEMRMYKFLELVSPSVWMELPCHVHLDTQTLYDAAGANHMGDKVPMNQLLWAKNRPCALRAPHHTAVVHGATGGFGWPPSRMSLISSLLVKRLVSCAVNGTQHWYVFNYSIRDGTGTSPNGTQHVENNANESCWEAGALPPQPPKRLPPRSIVMAGKRAAPVPKTSSPAQSQPPWQDQSHNPKTNPHPKVHVPRDAPMHVPRIPSNTPQSPSSSKRLRYNAANKKWETIAGPGTSR